MVQPNCTKLCAIPKNNNFGQFNYNYFIWPSFVFYNILVQLNCTKFRTILKIYILANFILSALINYHFYLCNLVQLNCTKFRTILKTYILVNFILIALINYHLYLRNLVQLNCTKFCTILKIYFAN